MLHVMVTISISKGDLFRLVSICWSVVVTKQISGQNDGLWAGIDPLK